MATANGRTTYTKINTAGKHWPAKRSDELLVVMGNEPGLFAKVTSPLTKSGINIECFTSYAWGNEVAFRFVTNNNKKAHEILSTSGYDVQECPVALWYIDNTAGALGKATAALANASIDTYCSYMTAVPNSHNTIVTFNTNDTDKTINVLNEIR